MNRIDPKFINQIICTDCVTGMRQLPDCCIPLTVTSPPYDDLRTYGGHSFDFKAVAEELWRITMEGGVVVWVVAEQVKNGSETGTSSEQRLHFRDIGFRLYDTIIMATRNPRRTDKSRYTPNFEYACILSKGRPRTANLLMKPNRTAGNTSHFSFRGENGQRIPTSTRSGVIKPYGRREKIWWYTTGSATGSDKIAYEHPALYGRRNGGRPHHFLVATIRPRV